MTKNTILTSKENRPKPIVKTKSWSYLLRVFLSFIILVISLDFFWSEFTPFNNNDQTIDFWQKTAVSLVEEIIRGNDRSFDSVSESQFNQLEQTLTEQIGTNVMIDSLEQLHLESSVIENPTLISINQQTYLLATFADINTQVRIGPLPETSNYWQSNLLTLGFYAIVALLIWIWLRPLTKGLDQLSLATQQFAQDYQQDLPSMDMQSPVKELAQSIESMAESIRGLIQTQAELTGGLSHEIRTPLARIKFALATVRDKVGEQSQLDSIEQDVEELEELVSAMLDYCRLQQTEQILQHRELDIRTLLDEIAEKYRWRTGAEIQIKTDHTVLSGDARLIPLAVSNLIANASRYAREHIHIHYFIEGQQQIIEISDDGPGIPEKERRDALSPFKKNTGPGASDGFGLGLAIVSRIMKLHGGSIVLSDSFSDSVAEPLSGSLNNTPTESRNKGLRVQLFIPFS